MNDDVWKNLGKILDYMKEDIVKLIIHLYQLPTYKTPKMKHPFTLEQETSEQLFLDFLRMKLGDEYYQIGIKAMQEHIFKIKDEQGNPYTKSGLDWSNSFYQISLNYNVSDVVTYAHEYAHYLQKANNTTSFMLGETIPIFIEQLATLFLKEQFPNERKIYFCDFERYQWNEESVTSEYICLCEEHLYTYYSLLSMRYIFGLLISCKLYQDYLLSPSNALKEAKQFALALEEGNFNAAMEAVGVNITYENAQLHYTNREFYQLLYCYKQHYQQLVNEYYQLNTKRLKFWK